MKEISVFDAKTHFSGIINKVYQHRESVTITRRGVPIAKIVPFDEKQTQDVMTVTKNIDIRHQRIKYVSFRFPIDHT